MEKETHDICGGGNSPPPHFYLVLIKVGLGSREMYTFNKLLSGKVDSNKTINVYKTKCEFCFENWTNL